MVRSRVQLCRVLFLACRDDFEELVSEWTLTPPFPARRDVGAFRTKLGTGKIVGARSSAQVDIASSFN